jgi:hypothetical protein
MALIFVNRFFFPDHSATSQMRQRRCLKWAAGREQCVPPRSFSSFGYDGVDGADERQRLARFQQFSVMLPRDRDFSVPAVLPSAVSARAAARRSRLVPLMLPMQPALPGVIFASPSSLQPGGLEKLSDRLRV